MKNLSLALSLLAFLVGCPDAAGILTQTMICAPGDRVCRTDAALVCSFDGSAWEVEPCADGESCADGTCMGPALSIVTELLPPGEVGAAYEAFLETDGGEEPLRWSAITGAVPPGLSLSETGSLSGVPEVPGDYVLGVAVEAADGAAAGRDFGITVHPESLEILTDANLGAVDEGVPLDVAFEAAGGVPNYGWFQLDGALPAGVTVDSAGRLQGTPLEPGRFDFGMRVVDSQEPPGYADGDFSLDVNLRPLVIVGENSFTLLGVSIVTLPLLTIVPGIPLPYSAQLVADGGLRPYAWTELQIPAALSFLISTGGIPANLGLQSDGLLTGSVTDTSQVITIGIPFHHGRLEGDESSSRPQTSATGPSCWPQGYPCGHADLA